MTIVVSRAASDKKSSICVIFVRFTAPITARSIEESTHRAPMIYHASRDWLKSSWNRSRWYRLSQKTFLRNLKFDHVSMYIYATERTVPRACMRDVIILRIWSVTVHIYGIPTPESSLRPDKWTDPTLTIHSIAIGSSIFHIRSMTALLLLGARQNRCVAAFSDTARKKCTQYFHARAYSCVLTRRRIKQMRWSVK